VAAPAYRSHTTASVNSDTLTINKPAGTASGDLLIAHIHHVTGNQSIDPTPPSGAWTLIGSRQANSSSSQWWFWAAAGGSEPASYDWTGLPSGFQEGSITAVSGADTTSPFHQTHQLQNTNIGGTSVALTVTTTITDCLLWASASIDAGEPTTFTQASMTERWDEALTTSDLCHAGYTGDALTADTYARTISYTPAQRCAGTLLAIAPGSGATTFEQSVAGSVTPAGALVKETQKPLGGSAGPAGAVTKQTGKTVTGSVTPAGAMVKQAAKILTGALTPSGAVATALVRLLSLAGSIAAAGALARQTNKALAGSATPEGALTKQTSKTFIGALTPAGAAAHIKTILLTLAGTLAAAGALVRQTAKPLAGSVIPDGAVTKQAGKSFAGSLTPAGLASVSRVVLLSLTGVVTPAGAMVKQAAKTLTGSLDPAGSVLKLVSKLLGGAVTPSGSSTHSLDIPQFNGTSTPTVTGLASTATVTALAPESTVTHGGSSTPTVSDG